jgi:hypothetical protein
MHSNALSLKPFAQLAEVPMTHCVRVCKYVVPIFCFANLFLDRTIEVRPARE